MRELEVEFLPLAEAVSEERDTEMKIWCRGGGRLGVSTFMGPFLILGPSDDFVLLDLRSRPRPSTLRSRRS